MFSIKNQPIHQAKISRMCGTIFAIPLGFLKNLTLNIVICSTANKKGYMGFHALFVF